MAARLRPSDSVASVIEVDVIDGYDSTEPDDYAPIREAWNGHSLDPSVPGLREALCDLSNACDELSRERGVSREELRFNRIASDSLSTLMTKVPA